CPNQGLVVYRIFKGYRIGVGLCMDGVGDEQPQKGKEKFHFSRVFKRPIYSLLTGSATFGLWGNCQKNYGPSSIPAAFKGICDACPGNPGSLRLSPTIIRCWHGRGRSRIWPRNSWSGFPPSMVLREPVFSPATIRCIGRSRIIWGSGTGQRLPWSSI